MGDVETVPGTRRAARLPELLAPAGGPDALFAALEAGADAVYAGLGAFSARAAAENFSDAELAGGAAAAHARGARIYVALNTSVSDGELEGALVTAETALSCGADALIVSDWGLASELSRRFPGAELHLSTQANVHARPGVLLAARELGVARVTTSRELPLSEIARLAACGVDVEVFCHGAICVCYSGACELSWRLTGRSALRGLCSQPCRLPYRLQGGDGAAIVTPAGDRLLCPRDLCSIRHIPELVRAGVASLKIEGRMKNPDYVHGVTRAYRAALDAVARGDEADADALEFELGLLFNRSFTDGYLTGRVDASLMSYERSCNQGVHVGRLVERVERGEYLAELDRPVGRGDTLEVRSCPDQGEKSPRPKRWSMVEAPRDAAAGERMQVHIKRKVEVGSDVHLVRSVRAVQAAAEAVSRARGAASRAGSPSPMRVRATAAEGGAWPRAGAGARPVPAGIELVAPSPELARWALDGAGSDLVSTVCVRAGRLGGAAGEWEELLPRVGVLLDDVCREDDLDAVRAFARRAAYVVCCNASQVALAREEGAAFEVAGALSAHSARAAAFFAGLGARRVWLSSEADAGAVAACVPAPDRGIACVAVHGRMQLMVTEVCLLRAVGPCTGECSSCARRMGRHRLECPDGRQLDVRVDGRGRSRVLDAEAWDAPAAPAGCSVAVDADLDSDEEARLAVRRAAAALLGAGREEVRSA